MRNFNKIRQKRVIIIFHLKTHFKKFWKKCSLYIIERLINRKILIDLLQYLQ